MLFADFVVVALHLHAGHMLQRCSHSLASGEHACDFDIQAPWAAHSTRQQVISSLRCPHPTAEPLTPRSMLLIMRPCALDVDQQIATGWV